MTPHATISVECVEVVATSGYIENCLLGYAIYSGGTWTAWRACPDYRVRMRLVCEAAETKEAAVAKIVEGP
jgi:hypothetical protein